MPNYHPFTPDPDAIARQMLTGTSVGADPSAPPVPPSPPRAAGELPTTLDGLTALRDRAFVEAAYRVVLGRDADPAGLEGLIHQLRSGALDKVDILGDLRHSSEGRQRNVEIPGLEWRYRLRRMGRWPGIGWAIRWVLAALRLPGMVRAAQRHQASIEVASVVAEEHAAAIQQLARDLRAHARTTAVRMDSAEAAVNELFELARSLAGRLDTTDTEVADLAARLAGAEKTFEERHQHLSTANARLLQQITGMARPVAAGAPSSAAAQPRRQAESAPPDQDEDWYLAFEDQFRGSREDIKRSQEIYLDYVQAAGAGTFDAPILDIGCGRGEWLELLQEHACVARGVDLNHAMVVANRERGLDVTERDVIAYLADLPEGSLGMVTGFHIIEHLRFDLLVRLFDECRRVLRPGGCILFETPNPENLVVGAYTFYFDPTHRNPLPPKMIEFVARERGYSEVEIVRLHPRAEEGSDHALLDKWFRGPTDYAVIGWKDGRRPT